MNRLFGAILTIFCMASSLAYASDSLKAVDELLQRASKALQEENYKGRFTYEFGNTLETLELVHTVKGGVEFERISHLSGEEREFVRGGRQQDCITAGSFLLRGGLVSVRGRTVSLAQNYHFYIQGEQRVAGRDVSIIKAIPKDAFRYGMTLAFDKASGLPLMSLTTTASKTALERFQFVQIEVGDDVLTEDLTSVESKHKVLDGSSIPCTQDPASESNWAAAWLPPGFVLSHATEDDDGGGALTYTDGIASFTVFITVMDGSKPAKQGVARRGATIAFMSLLPYKPQQVSVILVGEVPLVAAQQVTSSVVPIR